MRVIFTGTSEFAVPSLEALIASAHDVLAVITQPDKPHGRGRGVQMSPVKQAALAHGIPVLQPVKIKAPESVEEIMSYGPIAAMVVVAYGQKIPKVLLDWPPQGVVNVHGSILPKYRGAAPIQHAVMAGETVSGVTTMLMDEGWDTGDILLQDTSDVLPTEDAGELGARLAFIGSRLLLKTLNGLEDGTVAPTPQDDDLATYAPSLERDAGVIDWSAPADAIVNKVRGCTPRPGAYTRMAGALVKVWQAEIVSEDGAVGQPGEVIAIADGGIAVAAGTGSLRLLDVQPESRRRMSAVDFANGAKLSPGARFDVRFELPT